MLGDWDKSQEELTFHIQTNSLLSNVPFCLKVISGTKRRSAAIYTVQPIKLHRGYALLYFAGFRDLSQVRKKSIYAIQCCNHIPDVFKPICLCFFINTAALHAFILSFYKVNNLHRNSVLRHKVSNVNSMILYGLSASFSQSSIVKQVANSCT